MLCLGVVLALSDDERSFEQAFDRIEVGMPEAEVLELLGAPVEALGPGGAYPPPLEGTPTRSWYYGPNVTWHESQEPLWSVGFRDGKVLLLKTAED